MSDLQDIIVTSSVRAFNQGMYTERSRILTVLEPHLQQCDYEKSTGNNCDVCTWIKSTIEFVRGK
jgi:hypothetical protein